MREKGKVGAAGAVKALVSGYALTLRAFFSRGVTVSYPEQRRPVAPGYRGVPALRRHPDGRERCVACALCVNICPAGCISMITETGEDGRKRPISHNLEVGRCLFCGLCAEVCPVEAIVLSGVYEMLYRDRTGAVLDKDALLARGMEL